MSGWLQKLTSGGLLLLLVVSICLGGYSSLLSHRLELARQHVAEQQKTLAQQAGLIATLQTQDAQNRALMAAQQQQEQQLRQQADIFQRKYRDATKNNKCAVERMPDAVLELLRGTDTNAASANRSVTP
ncbi:hypothetical protein [Serratia entomophila]|uniref:hypothetical protein n=1 Tax=Serratia entomophila TaxID=42906 RepID=UPI0021B7819F|nr:hypothetical protein [Serratia entomophila]